MSLRELRLRLRALAVRGLGARRMRGLALRMVRARYVRRWPRPVCRAYDRVLLVQQPAVEQRQRSVSDLVEVFFDLCALTDIDLFVEAGAKEATASQRAAGEQGIERVVAFEANPYTYARFAKRFDDDLFEYVHLALGARDEPVTFMVRRRDDGTPIPDGQGSLLVRPDHSPGYEHVTVESVRLDSFFADGSFERVAMWVDVEGATDQVFGGAARLLASCELILVEVESRVAWEGQAWLDTDVEDAMAIAGLRPVARDAQSRFQHNVLFVREESTKDPRVAERLRDWRTGSRS